MLNLGDNYKKKIQRQKEKNQQSIQDRISWSSDSTRIAIYLRGAFPMSSEDTPDRDRKRPPREEKPFDPFDYHRRLVTAILNEGVEKASPLQIFERMTLPLDPTNYTFRDLQLGQIKSHLQRFRKIYKSENPAKSSRSSVSSSSFLSGTTLSGNAEKDDFLDDYDNFVDFGLDAAAARSDEHHTNVLGGRIIGLVSRMIMMNEGVKIQDFSKHQNLQEKDGNADPMKIPKQTLDKSIPILSSSEKATPLGQSIQLVVNLVHYLNNFIENDRQRARSMELLNQTLEGQQPLYPNATLGAPILQQGQPLHPQQPLIHPSFAGQLLRQSHQQLVQNKQNDNMPPGRSPPMPPHITNIPQQLQPIQVQMLPQPQQQRRARADSLSDVSSIGDARALITDEDLHFELLMPPKSHPSEPSIPENEVPNQPRLGKFIPVTTFKKPEPNSQVVQGRIYHPSNTDPQQQQQQTQQQLRPIPPIYIQQRAANSFETPQHFLAGQINNHNPQTDSFTQHALAALAATAVAAAQGWGATANPAQQPPATNGSVGPTYSLPQKQPRLSRKVSSPKTKRRRKRYKHPTKHKMLKTLHKVLTEIGLKKADFQRRKERRSSSLLASHLQNLNRNATSKTILENDDDDDASMVSSLSSSSSSSIESVASSKAARSAPVSQLPVQPEGGLVSPANTGSASNSYQKEEQENEKEWMFHHNPIPRNLRLEVFETQGGDEHDDDDDDYNSWCSKNSTSTEQKWGLIKQQQQQQEGGSSR